MTNTVSFAVASPRSPKPYKFIPIAPANVYANWTYEGVSALLSRRAIGIVTAIFFFVLGFGALGLGWVMSMLFGIPLNSGAVGISIACFGVAIGTTVWQVRLRRLAFSSPKKTRERFERNSEVVSLVLGKTGNHPHSLSLILYGVLNGGINVYGSSSASDTVESLRRWLNSAITSADRCQYAHPVICPHMSPGVYAWLQQGER